MWNIASLARRGAWLSLLGSMLVLAACFLPYFHAPSGSFLSSRSLWDFLVLFMNTGVGIVVLSIIGLLLLVLGNVVLAVLMLLLRSPRRSSMTILLTLTQISLFYYLFGAGIAFLLIWVDMALSESVTFLDVLSRIGIGAWFILAGLALAYLGSILLKRQQAGASA